MITYKAVESYCEEYSKAESSLLKEVHAYTQANVHGAHMLSDVLVGGLLQLLVRLMQPKFILDLGTYTGYSALTLAEASWPETTILTCDQSLPSLEIAKTFFNKSKDQYKIKIFAGRVMQCIESITEVIDFVFVDADKMHIKAYIDALYPKLRVGGVIVIDNVLWRGEVINPEEKYAQALDQLNRDIKKDKRFVNVLLPIRDGLNIMTKL